MYGWEMLFTAFVVGAGFGMIILILYSCCFISSESDKRNEKLLRELTQKQEG